MSDDVVSLPGLAHQLGVALGTSDTVGGFIATFIFIGITVFPILFLTKGRNIMLCFIVGLLDIGLGVALAWLPYWMLFLVVLAVAAMISGTFRDWITGRGRG